VALITIDTIDLEPAQHNGLTAMEARARAWCQRLEAGDILYFPQTPIRFRPEDLSFLLGASTHTM
jgi:hypothetical protein